MEVTLEQMLAAREERAMRLFTLSREFRQSLVSFSMNIPGPEKDNPLIRRGFLEGCRGLDDALAGHIRHRAVFPQVTGWEGVWVVDLPALEVKKITTAIEDGSGLGRLFDMDVLDDQLRKLDREEVGGGSRDCMVCGAPGRGCASRRLHSVAQLQNATRGILTRHFREEDAIKIGSLAVQSLLDEVNTTPKPGLVDRRNTGSHRDMDVDTFYRSARALAPYFLRCVEIGQETAEALPEETFPLLRSAGLEAERAMYEATGGVNTHKGAIFTLGILCGAAGRLWQPEGRLSEDALFREAAAMSRKAMEQDLRQSKADTAGLRLYKAQGIKGIRGQAMEGFPAVSNIGLPAYQQALARGVSSEEAGVLTLLTLIAQVEDTNMHARGGAEGAKQGALEARRVLEADFCRQAVEALDDWFVERNLSPGGCADLLAAVYFVQGLLDGGIGNTP